MLANTFSSPLAVVYCLTSTGCDLYEAMTRVSVGSLRLTNPTARIIVACDKQTLQALRDSGSFLLQEINDLYGFATPDGPATFRNRYIKTKLRLLISGPFLFLDSDTVVRKPLDSLLNLNADIAAAPNHSADLLAEQIWSEDQSNLDFMGWQIRAPYVNGGVIWYSQSPCSYRVAESWHRLWLENVTRTGRFRDQPALNHALSSAIDINFYTLPHTWNAQIGMRAEHASEAFIWHVYSSTGLETDNIFNHFCQRVSKYRPKTISAKAVKVLVRATSLQRKPSLITKIRSKLTGQLSSLSKRW